MNEIILHGDDDVEICLSLTNMRINARNVNEQSLLMNKLNGKRTWALHMLSVQDQKTDSRGYESIPIRDYEYYESVSYVKQMLRKAIRISTRVTGYVKNVSRRT